MQEFRRCLREEWIRRAVGDEAVKAEHWKDGFEMLLTDGLELESAQDLKAAIKEEEKAGIIKTPEAQPC